AADVGALTDAQATQKYALRSIKINGKPLSADVNLLAGDIDTWNKTEADGRYLMKAATAAAATKLATPRKINGVAFDGTADINLTPQNIGFVEQLIYPEGTENAPGTITANKSVNVANPFNTLSCMIQIEFLIDGEWGVACNGIHEGTIAGQTMGIGANFLDKNTIMIKTGSATITRGGLWDANPWNKGQMNSAKYRLRVIKLT
ncbi:hypothetical protein H5A22_07375, partial [Pectobacterium brasiliense]|nr:hypothetical protein [Pectobacterium brasiliense]